MKYITQQIFNNIEVKKSTFLSFVFPFGEFDSMMASLRREHPKAVHFVYAYRRLEDAQVVERFCDDGEPKGSSGMPVLNVLRGNDLIESAAIVVRYFGGTLLGVGGLVRAYTQGVVACIKEAQQRGIVQEYLLKEEMQIQCPYTLFAKVEYLLKNLDIEIAKQHFDAHEVALSLCGRPQKLELFASQFQELQYKGSICSL